MIKLNKKHLIFISLVFFIFANKVNANVMINEVLISPTEGRFIELYNNGGSTVDLTDWYIQRKTVSGTFGSMVTKTNFEGISIESNGYLLISKGGVSGTDVVVDTLTLTESNTIQMKDGSGNVVDKVGWGEANDCSSSCPSNPTTGQSISRSSGGGFILANPTPKEANTNTVNNNQDTSSSTTTSSNNNESPAIVSKNNTIEFSKILTKILAPKVVTAGVPFLLDHSTTGLNKEKIILGKFVWNFGDGMGKELSVSEPFNYIYDYPGEYVLSLSYSDSVLDAKPDAVDRLTIKVIPSGVLISSVGSYSDPFVELENKSNYEMFISGWVLKGSVHTFVIPDGTVILANKKLKLSPKITGFDFNDLNSVSVVDRSGQIFASYPNSIKSIVKYSTSRSGVENIVKSDVIASIQSEDMGNNGDVINLNSLGASTGGVESSLNNKTLFYLGLLGIILLGMASIILLRRKTEVPDYIDGGINPKDMNLID